MTTAKFNREMMNLCGAETSPFPESWFKFHHSAQLNLSSLTVASHCDPSAKQGEANDFKAIVTVGWDREESCYRCLHAWIRHASPKEMLAAAYRIHDAYGGPMGLEDNMLEDFLHETIYNYAREVGRYLPWRPVHHTTNKEARIINTLSYLVEHGKLTFEKGHSDQDRLREQLIYILNKNVKDDGPDALEGAVSLLQEGVLQPVEYETVAVGRWAEEQRHGGYARQKGGW
jgi:predicted phage terminase large subunit-like protein